MRRERWASRRHRSRCRVAMSACARRWTSSSLSRPARRTCCRSTARRERRSRPISRSPDSIAELKMAQTQQQIADNRRRYEELRAAGQELTPKGLPERTALGSVPIAPDAVIHRETVPAGWYTTMRLRRGEVLRIVDEAGRSSISLIGWREEDTSERINCADTVKVQWSAAIGKGRVILSDMGRVLLSVIEDTSGAHDLLVGGSTSASTLAAFGMP